MIELLVILGLGGIISEVIGRSCKKNLKTEIKIPGDQLTRMDKQLDQLYQDAKEQIRRMR